ncbi:PAS domain-containing protein [Streptomyces sp. NPDC002004]
MSSRPSRGAARLAAILDALPDALVLVNANGTVVNANSIALEAFEAPGTALVGRGLLDLLPEFDSRLIPGSMRRPDTTDERGRTKPTRMMARRTDGGSFPVEVTSANLENGQQAYDGSGYTGDELLMLVVRDLSGAVDTEAELARSQRQTEMILRAASEGVVGTDTEGRVVLVNPAAAQILGYRASDLGGKDLHELVLHHRENGESFPYEGSPLADTLRSGRKHRVRGQVLWSKTGDKVPVDLTTAPVRDGDQLVGAVLTFTDRRAYDALVAEKEQEAERHTAELDEARKAHEAEVARIRERYESEAAEAGDAHESEMARLVEEHAEELAAEKERYASLGEREKDRYEALAARHEQLLAVLGGSLRGPLDQLRGELGQLAADDAGQLWPEANQVLHHLAAGYSRMTTLVDNVLGYQRLDAGAEVLARRAVMFDAVVTAGVDGAVELIGPGRAQFAVHAPPIEAEVDPERLATALAHLVADVAGVDATGNAPVAATGYMDSTIVVAAAQRGDVVRIEVRGPYAGGDPVHQPIVRGIVRAHGGVLQTHEVPGMTGAAYVLEVPIGGGAGTVPADRGTAVLALPGTDTGPTAEPDAGTDTGAGADTGAGTQAGAALALPAQASGGSGRGGRRRARRASVDAFLESGAEGPTAEAAGTEDPHGTGSGASADSSAGPEGAARTGTGRRRGRRAEESGGTDDTPQTAVPAAGPGTSAGGTGRRRGRPSPAEGAVMTADEPVPGAPALGAVPPQGMPAPTGRRARRAPEQHALPALPSGTRSDTGAEAGADVGPAAVPDGAAVVADPAGAPQPGGRRARRALAPAGERPAPDAGAAPGRAVFALPPAAADRAPFGDAGEEQHAVALRGPEDDHTPAEPHPTAAPGGRRRGRRAAGEQNAAGAPEGPGRPGIPGQALPVDGAHGAGLPATGLPAQMPQPQGEGTSVPGPLPGGPQQEAAAPGTPAHGTPAQAAPARGVPAESVPAQGTPAQGTPAQGTPAQGVQEAGAPAAGTPASGIPAYATPADGVPAQGAQPIAVPANVAPAVAVPPSATPAGGIPAHPTPAAGVPAQAAQGAAASQPGTEAGVPGTPGAPADIAPAAPADPATPPNGVPAAPQPRVAQPLPAEAAPGDTGSTPANPTANSSAQSTQGRSISVRTLGQGVPFRRQLAEHEQQRAAGQPRPQGGTQGGGAQPLPPQQPQAPAPSQTPPGPLPATTAHPTPAGQTSGSGRRRKLGTPGGDRQASATATQTGIPAQNTAPQPQPATAGSPAASAAPAPSHPRLPSVQSEGRGRAYAIGAPDDDAEGPEPLDGPNGAVEIANQPQPQRMDDELPPEPLDNPRRLLVWPAPDMSTQQALSDRGYRPVTVNSREEVDAQIAAFPAALFVDPLTGPITRTALQSLRQAAVAAEVPVLVTAGLGQATREAAYGADPAVLLKALAPRDSEQHPPRVLLIEEHTEIAMALTATLERRGMQVARAETDADAVTLAGQMRPNLVVMDLMQVRRRRAGIVDWLRANGRLNRTPLVVYTAAVDPADLPRLAAGESVLFLAERSTNTEVQDRIVDLLAKIGTN